MTYPAGLIPDEPLPDGLVPDAAPPLPPGLVADAGTGQPTAVAPAPVYEPASEEEERQRDDDLRGLFDAGITKVPDKYAGVISLTKASGAPVDIVEKNYDAFKQSAERDAFDPRKWRYDNPGLYNLIVRDPKLAPVVIKDVELKKFIDDLGGDSLHYNDPQTVGMRAAGFGKHVETTTKQQAFAPSPLRGLDMLTDTYTRRRVQSEIASLGTQQMGLDAAAMAWANNPVMGPSARLAAYENEKAAIRLQQQLGLAPDYGQAALGQLGIDLADGAGSMMDSWQAVLKGGGAGGAVGAAVGGVGGALVGEPVAGAFGGARVGAALGATGASVLSTFNQEAGSAYLDFRDSVDDKGRPMDPAVAIGAAALYGVAAAAVEFETVGPMLRAFGIDASGGGLGLHAAIKAVVGDSAKHGALARFGAKWAEHVIAEGNQEAIQSLLQSGIQWAGESASAGKSEGKLFEPQKFDFVSAVDEAAESWYKGGLSAAAMLPVEAVSTAAVGRVRTEIAELAARRAQSIAALAAAPTAQAAPSALADFVAEETRKNGQETTHLYIDPMRLVAAIQGAGMKPETAVPELLGENGWKRLQSAFLRRVDENGLRATLEVPTAEVFEKWRDNKAIEASLQDMTTRPGYMTARETMEMQAAAPGLLAAQTENVALTEQAQTASSALSVEPRVMPAMRAEFAGLPSPAEQQITVYTDLETGLLTPAGYEARQRDQSRPMQATFAPPALKAINDAFGHDAGNDVIRAMARVVAKFVPDATIRKGDIIADVRDRAHAEEIAQAMSQEIDPQGRLHVVPAAVQRLAQPRETNAALKAEKDKRKAKAVEAKLVGERGSLPPAFQNAEALRGSISGLAVGAKAATEMTGEHAAGLAALGEKASEAAYLDRSGALNNRGFDGAIRHKAADEHVLIGDIRAFGKIDKLFGERNADAVLHEFFGALMDIGGGEVNGAHPSGDEIGGVAAPALLGEFSNKLEERAAGMVFFSEVGGKVAVQDGLTLALGVAQDKPSADSASAAKKLEQDKAGAVREPRLLSAEEANAVLGQAEADGRIVIRVEDGHAEVVSPGRGDLAAGESGTVGAGSREPETLPQLLKALADLRRRSTQAETFYSNVPGQRQVPLASEAIEAAARDTVDNMALRRLSASDSVRREQAMGDMATVAAAKGDFKAALKAKQQQVFLRFQGRFVTEARQIREKLAEILHDQQTQRRQQTMGSAGVEFLHASDHILEALGAKPVDEDAAATRVGIDAALQTIAAADASGVAFPIDRLTDLVREPVDGGWKSLSVSDARLVHDALTELYTMARDRVEIVDNGRRVEIADFVRNVEAEASYRKDKGRQKEVSAPRKAWREMWASAREAQEILRSLGDSAYRIWGMYIDAEKTRDALISQAGGKLIEAIDAIPADIKNRRGEMLTDTNGITWPEDIDREPVIDRSFMWMVALNMGNLSNMERLLGGYGWAEHDVREWLNRNMSKAEWDFVQSVFDVLDRDLYPQVAKTFKEAKGIEPKKIKALAFETPHGTYRGGYFPAKYDPVASRVGQNQRLDDLMRSYNQKPGAISVARSFTQNRAEKYEDVIRLDWNVVPSHVASVVHYVGFDKFVRQARGIMTNPVFERTVRHRLGDEYLQELTHPDGGFLATVAGQGVNPTTGFETVAGWMKSAFMMKALAWNIPAAGADIVNPMADAVLGKSSPLYVAKSMARAFSGLGFVNMRAVALEKSAELRRKRDVSRRHIMNELRNFKGGGALERIGGLHERLKELAFLHFEMMDRVTSTIAWDAVYRKGIADGLGEEAAVAKAEDVVQSTTVNYDDPARRAGLFRKRGLSQLLIFMGYFNKRYNVLRTAMDPWLVRLENAEGIGDHLKLVPNSLYAAAAVGASFAVSQLLGEYLMGKGKEADEEVPEWITRKMLAAPFAMTPVVGAFGEWTANVASSLAFHGEYRKKEFSPRGTPVAVPFEQVSKDLIHFFDQGRDGDQRFWDLIDATGFITPLGANALVRAGRYATGGENRSLPGAASGLIYGERKTQAANPFSDAR